MRGSTERVGPEVRGWTVTVDLTSLRRSEKDLDSAGVYPWIMRDEIGPQTRENHPS